MEHLWNAIVCEHGDLIDIMKEAIAFAFEAGPQVGYQDLRPLMKPNGCIFEAMLIVEAGKVVDYNVHKSSCRSFGLLDAADEATIERLCSVSDVSEAKFKEPY